MWNADGTFTYTPDADFNGTDSFTFKANDGTVDSNVATVSLIITAVNDAPVLSGNAVLESVLEASDQPAGELVSSLFGGLVSDVDIDIAERHRRGERSAERPGSLAVLNGRWRTTGLPSVRSATTDALVLAGNAQIRFLPELGYAGDPVALVARVIDSSFAEAFTDGANRSTVDVTANGGTTPFSAATGMIQTQVTDDEGKVWLSIGNLFVTGTSDDDVIIVRPGFQFNEANR